MLTSNSDFPRLRVAVIDGPLSPIALSQILPRAPLSLHETRCAANPKDGCNHGTFIVALLGARADAPIAGLCPDCQLVHVGLFSDENAGQTSVADLAFAITAAVRSGASLINLSLGVLAENSNSDEALALALDRAEAAGAVVMAAAGNQGRLTVSQILSHPVTIPVVATDATGKLLHDSNFSPLISRKGVAALGDQVRGYAPDGDITTMSGTSVATAVATGIVAQVWSVRPNVDGPRIRAALAGLPGRNGLAPPRLTAATLLVKLDQILATRIALQSALSNSLRLQGASVMSDGNEKQRLSPRAVTPFSGSRDNVPPPQGVSSCTCGGASNGSCSCGGNSLSRFVYVLGTVDCRFPDQSVSDEFQAAAETIGIQQEELSLRSWIYRVLSDDPLRSGLRPGLRYIARQLCWVLTVEKQAAYYLNLRDWQDLDDLIVCLGQPDDADVGDLTLIAGSSSLVPVETSPGVLAPILQVEQLCPYKLQQFIDWCKDPPQPGEAHPPRLRRGARGYPAPAYVSPDDLFRSLFKRVVQAADNFGDSDESRALNYLAVRCKALYQLYCEKVGSGQYLLDSVKVVPSRLWRDRRIVDPVFSFVQRNDGALEKYFLRVDVTSLFPFLINSLQINSGHFVPNYFDR